MQEYKVYVSAHDMHKWLLHVMLSLNLKWRMPSVRCLRLAQDKSETDRALGVGLATLRRVGAQLSLSSLAPLLEVRMDSVKVAWNKGVLNAKTSSRFPHNPVLLVHPFHGAAKVTFRQTKVAWRTLNSTPGVHTVGSNPH